MLYMLLLCRFNVIWRLNAIEFWYLFNWYGVLFCSLFNFTFAWFIILFLIKIFSCIFSAENVWFGYRKNNFRLLLMFFLNIILIYALYFNRIFFYLYQFYSLYSYLYVLMNLLHLQFWIRKSENRKYFGWCLFLATYVILETVWVYTIMYQSFNICFSLVNKKILSRNII